MWLYYLLPIVSLIVYHIISSRYLHPLSKVPGPFWASITPLWIVWQQWNYRRPNIDLKLHKKYGSVVRTSPDEVMFSNPEYFRAVYGAGTHFARGDWYHSTPSLEEDRDWDQLNMLVEMNAEKLRAQKRAVGPMFTLANVKKHEKLVDATTLAWSKRLRTLEDTPLDFGREMELLIIDAMAEITFAKPFGALENGTDGGHLDSLKRRWHVWGWAGYIPWLNKLLNRLPTRSFLRGNPEFLLFQFGNAEIARFQQRAEAGEENASCIHEDLRRASAVHSELRPGWVFGISMTDLGAGVETSSWTMATCVAGIAMDKAVYHHVQTEIDSAIAAGRIRKAEPISYDAAASLGYLQNCLHEAMRKWPNIVIPLQRCVPAEGITVDGHYLPPGTKLGMSSMQLGRDNVIFGPDTVAFRPERWQEASKGQLQDMHNRNLAFGGPSRKCVGQHLAWVVMTKLLAFLFVNFDVQVLNKLNGPPGPGGHRWIEMGAFPLRWEGFEVRVAAR